MIGWLKLHRKLRNNKVLKGDANAKALFVDLLIEAAWEPCEACLGGKTIKLERGQLAISLSSFAESETGLTRQQARTAIAKLTNGNMVRCSRLPTNAGVLISIVNFDTYQGGEEVANQGSNQPPTNLQPTSIKEDKKRRILTPPTPLLGAAVDEPSARPEKPEAQGSADDFEDWWAAYPRKVGKPDALKKYRAARKATRAEALMIGLARWQRYWERRHQEPDKIPHPATWLHQQRYNDDPDGCGQTPEEQRRQRLLKLVS